MATSLRSNRVSRKLNFEDVLCPICRTIYIEPVSLPCKHVVCKQCLEKTVESNTLTCPICRTRIGSFLRVSRSSGKLVDQSLWEDMKVQFPREIRMKQNGEEDGIADKFLEVQKAPKLLAKRGSIRQEFEEMLKKLKTEEEKNRLAEEVASKKLAQEIMEQELAEENERKRRQEEIAQSDMIFIQNLILAEKSQEASLLSDSNRKDFQSSHSSSRDNPSCSNGRDSITAELRHFTPICIVPKTPPKRLPNGKIQEAKLLKPINMAANIDDNETCPSPQRVNHKSALKVYSNNFVRTKSEDAATSAENVAGDCKVAIEDKNVDILKSNVRNILYPDIIKNQEMIQSRIEQEQQDLALALKLQAEWNMKFPEKRQHSYMLRSAQKRKKEVTSDT